jgi:small subunit ribosomal protein S10
MPREYKLTYKDLKLFRKNNKKFIQYNLKKFFFNRLLNKYLNISANNYFLKPNELNYYINSNFLEREIDKINIERKINLFKVSKILIKNNLQKRFFNTITEDTNVLNSNKKNDGNNFFLTEVNKEEVKFKNKENICIRLVFKSFDKKSLEYSKSLLLKLFLKKKNIKISIINLPTNKTKYTILKSPHIDKRSRDQFEKVIYKSLINFIIPEYIFNKEFINFFLYLIKKISPTIYIQYIIIKN